MPSTYSPSLKLELIGNGEQSGTWGTTTNNNFGTLVEQAITGVQSIVMSDADYTLTNYNGLSDEARNPVLSVTGTNTAVRQIVAPLVNKLYTVFNNTTGGYAITIGGASGANVSIPSNTTALVYCDSANFYGGLSGVTGNFRIPGNLTTTGNVSVTGTSTLTGNTTVGGTLSVTGNASVSGNSAVTGNTTIGGTLGVTGNTTVNNLTITGSVTGINTASSTKAWANFAGGTGSPLTVNGSLNITSINRTGLGSYTVNFTSAVSGNYAVVAGSAVQLGQSISSWTVALVTNQNSNGFQINYVGTNGANFDITEGNFAVFG